VTAVRIAEEPLSVASLDGFWRLAAALEPVLARVVLLERGEGSASAPAPLPGLEIVRAGREEPLARVLATLADGAEPAASAVLALAFDALAGWAAEEIARVDDYAARVVALRGGWATSLAAPPGALLVARPRMATAEGLERLLGGGGAAGALGEAPFDFSALRRLRDLDVAPGAVSVALVSGLGRVRDLLARSTARARPILALDRVRLVGAAGASSAARVEVEGWIVDLPPVRDLVVRVGERRYAVAVDGDRADVAGRTPFLPDVRCGFRFARRIDGLGGGEHEVALERRDGRRLRRLGTLRVGTTPAEGAAALEIDRCEVLGSGRAARLRLGGAMRAAAGVESLRVEVDGRRLFDVDRRLFAPDHEAGDAERILFETTEAVRLDPGAHRLRVAARQGQDEVASWSREIEVDAAAAPPPRLVAPGWDDLAREDPSPVRGALRVRGALEGAEAGARVELLLDGVAAAASEVGQGGAFALRHELTPERRYDAELRAVEAVEGGAELVRSRRARLLARPLSAPAGWAAAIEAIVAAVDSAPLAEVPPAELAERLAELGADELGQMDAALKKLAGRAAAISSVGAALPPEAEPPERPLRVLFASWEIPWSGHGGGVHLVQLLRHLGARHEITLVHPEFPGSEGLSEEVRGSVREILTPQRGWQPPGLPRPFGLPERELWTHSRELAATVAAELASGRYDLLNCEGAELLAHCALRDGTPALLSALEYPSYAELAAAPARFADIEEAAAHLDRLLRALYRDAVLLPGRFDPLVALTAPEVGLLARFVPRARLAENPIAVELAGRGGAAAGGGGREPATFVFVGTYRHPPNLEAAGELVDAIFPAIRSAIPEARCLLVGADPPPELTDRAAAAGVELLGWVDDLDALLGRATAFVAPLRSGAGMRVKLLDAMACGCPIVATELGMTGIAAREGEEYIRATTPAELAAAAARLAADPGEAARLGESGRGVVERDHSIAVQGERRERIWAATIARSGAGS